MPTINSKIEDGLYKKIQEIIHQVDLMHRKNYFENMSKEKILDLKQAFFELEKISLEIEPALEAALQKKIEE